MIALVLMRFFSSEKHFMLLQLRTYNTYHKLLLDLSFIVKNCFMYQKQRQTGLVLSGLWFPCKVKASCQCFFFFFSFCSQLHSVTMATAPNDSWQWWSVTPSAGSQIYVKSSMLINHRHCIKKLLHGCVAFRNVHVIQFTAAHLIQWWPSKEQVCF